MHFDPNNQICVYSIEPEHSVVEIDSWKKAVLDNAFFGPPEKQFTQFQKEWASTKIIGKQEKMLYNESTSEFIPLNSRPGRCAVATGMIIPTVFVHTSLSDLGVVIRGTVIKLIELTVGEVLQCEYKFGVKKNDNVPKVIDDKSEDKKQSNQATMNLEQALSWRCTREPKDHQPNGITPYSKKCSCEKLLPLSVDDFIYRPLLENEIKAARKSQHMDRLIKDFKKNASKAFSAANSVLDETVT